MSSDRIPCAGTHLCVSSSPQHIDPKGGDQWPASTGLAQSHPSSTVVRHGIVHSRGELAMGALFAAQDFNIEKGL